MNNLFEKTVLEKWLAELRTTLEDNNENGANRDGIQVWLDDGVDKLYRKIATSDDDERAYEYTIDGAKQLESENDLQHSTKGYNSVDKIHDETVSAAIGQLTILALNDWLSGSGNYIIDVDELEDGGITWDLFGELMNRQRAVGDDLLNSNYIYCGIYYYSTQAIDDPSEIHTFDEWSNLLDAENSLYDTIVEYAG